MIAVSNANFSCAVGRTNWVVLHAPSVSAMRVALTILTMVRAENIIAGVAGFMGVECLNVAVRASSVAQMGRAVARSSRAHGVIRSTWICSLVARSMWARSA